MPGPTLAIMAAGIGSRYGGLKQIEPVGPSGEIIIDYSIYDALRAGFTKVVFIIRRGIEDAFREKVGRNIEGRAEVEYVFQDLSDLPQGFSVPAAREKPWGTGHAVLSAREKIGENFAVINADDFYGVTSFAKIGQYLTGARDRDGVGDYCLVGFTLWKTLSDHGHVARGICAADEGGYLTEISERTKIRKSGDTAEYAEDNGETWTAVSRDSLASMNMWGFTPGYLEALWECFPAWLEKNIGGAKTEFYLPETVGQMIREGQARVKVLPTDERWFGVTYREDAPLVKAVIRDLVDRGLYQENLWGDRNG